MEIICDSIKDSYVYPIIQIHIMHLYAIKIFFQMLHFED